MDSAEQNIKLNYRVLMVEANLPHSYSGKVDVTIEDNNTICLSVYNNKNLYKLLTKAIEKYFS